MRIRLPRPIVATTMMIAATFGSMCSSMIRRLLLPKRLGRFDIGVFLHRQRGAPDDARVLNAEAQPQHRRDVEEPGTQQRHNGEQRGGDPGKDSQASTKRCTQRS